MLDATVDALNDIDATIEPTEALFLAASEMLTAVVEDRGVMPRFDFWP